MERNAPPAALIQWGRSGRGKFWYLYTWLTKMTHWIKSHRADPQVVPIADRHYNRQKVGSPQFVPPGSCLVLKTPCLRAFWVTSCPKAEYVKHAWAGAWICSAFRNEGAGLSSDLILQAVAHTLDYYGAPPSLGMITFVDRSKTRPKSRDHIGDCFQNAGFLLLDAMTKGGLYVLQMLPRDMPESQPVYDPQLSLW